jgi:putative membrane protein
MMHTKIGATLVALALTFATAPAQSAEKLTDPQIAHIAYTAGDLDIKAAQLALKMSKNAEVIAFANNMVSDHMAVNDQALALLKRLNVTPEDNDVSKGLVKQSTEEQAKLAKLNGPNFDKAYVANELAYHKTVNSALEKTLIPSASNAELKDLLSTGLKIFQGHQEHAEMLVKTLK